jgi:hypothetical protein
MAMAAQREAHRVKAEGYLVEGEVEVAAVRAGWAVATVAEHLYMPHTPWETPWLPGGAPQGAATDT